MESAFFQGIQNEIIKRLSLASQRISIAVAWFTNEHLFEEIIKCLKRNVSVKLIIFDDAINRNEHGLNFSDFINAGGKLYFSSSFKVHHKFCIIDRTLISGSYNWTYYADAYNAENIIVSDNQELVQSFENEFERLLAICSMVEKYEPIKFSNIADTELYKNYDYLCNDLYLKSRKFETEIIRINQERGINIIKPTFRRNAENDIKTDKRGIPLLKKSLRQSSSMHRLVDFSIEEVPSGRPNSGRKYVRARYISDGFLIEDRWVDIFDSEYVESTRKYFHKKNRGLLDDNSVLPLIPEEIYNPMFKYHFKLVHYMFDGLEVKGPGRHKLGSDGRIIQKNGKPCEYSQFYTLIRYEENPYNYIEFASMTELCHLIVNSLFCPNNPNDKDIITDLLCPEGTFQATIDDYESLCREVERTEFPNAVITRSQIKDILQNSPKGIWVLKDNGQIMACAYGLYDNTFKFDNQSYFIGDGEWYIIYRLKALFNQEQRQWELLKTLISIIKNDSKKGIIYNYCPNNSVVNLENLGFVKYIKSDRNGKRCVMRMSF